MSRACPECGWALEKDQFICPKCWSDKKLRMGPGPVSRGHAGKWVVTLDRPLGRRRKRRERKGELAR